jgi:hypothetical protein
LNVEPQRESVVGAGAVTGAAPLAPADARLRFAAWGLLLIPVAMLAYRLVRIDLSPFIMDEAYFLDGAGWALASPITGSTPVHYGPAVVWFFGVAQFLVGKSPLASIAAMCVTMTVAHLAFGIAVGRALKLKPLAFAAFLAFLAASPYQFFWSRLAWNQLPDACAFAAVAMVISVRPLTVSRMAIIGVLLGLALSAHPISAAFIAAVGLLVAVDHRHDLKQLVKLGATGVAAILAVNVPWFVDMVLRPWPPLEKHPSRPLPAVFADVGVRMLDELRPASLSGIQYFFDAEWGHFVRALDWPAQPELVAQWLFIALVVLCAIGLVAAAFGERSERRLALLTVATFVSSAMYFSYLQIGPHPHYNFPVSWIAPAAVALVLSVSGRRRTTAIAAGTVVAVMAVIQFGFILQWRGVVAREGGVRCLHYSTPVGQLRTVVNEACSWPSPVQVRNQTMILPKPLEYLLKTEPLCEGKHVQVCGWACPPPAPGTQSFALRYAAPFGASVTLVPE